MAELPFFHVAFSVDLPGLATTAVAIAHGEKILGVRAVNGLVQTSRMVVSHALGRDMRLVYKFNCNVVISALVL